MYDYKQIILVNKRIKDYLFLTVNRKELRQFVQWITTYYVKHRTYKTKRSLIE
nr:MAG TPA: hypothetical protein [Caudoviricetes sp.]